MKPTKTLILLTCLLGLGLELGGAPVDSAGAAAAVSGWLRLDAAPLGALLGGKIQSVETFRDDRGAPLYHVVYLAPAGYVIVAAEDQVEPVIAFVKQGRFDPAPSSPLGALVGRDLPARVAHARGAKPNRARAEPAGKWQRLLQSSSAAISPNSVPTGQISDLRVAPFVHTQWNQDTNSSGVSICNYFTPPYGPGTWTNYPSGCVATALGQLMYYYRYPSLGVGTGSFLVTVAGIPMMRGLRGGDGYGGPYNWNGMPTDLSAPTPAQCQAVGTLLSDTGVAVHMQYTAFGSGALMPDAKQALVSTFKYGNVVLADSATLNVGVDLISMINPNLDSGRPVIFGIDNALGGHAIVCDGYGYCLGTLYHHLNMGWGGFDDTWYALPIIDILGGLPYLNLNACLFNIFTNGAGEIISGRVLDTGGVPVANASVIAARASGDTYSATTAANGIYALAGIPSLSSYTLTVSKTGYFSTQTLCSNGISQDYGTNCGNLWGVNFAILAAQGPPVITNQPLDQLAASGAEVALTANATGALPLYYQWQALASGGSVWTDLPEGAGYAGTRTPTLTVSQLGAAMNGVSLRCVVTNTYATNSAGLAVSLPAVIRILSPQTLAFATLAGVPGNVGSADGANAAAAFYRPRGIVVDGGTTNLYITDMYNHTVRKARLVGSDWVVTTIAGLAGSSGSADGTNSAARFNAPYGIARDGAGNLYVADTGNSTIRKLTLVSTNWVVSTIAGSPGSTGFGDGISPRFRYPTGIAVDGGGNLFVADQANSTIRKLSLVGTNWIASTIAGAAGSTGSADGTNTASRFSNPYGIAVDSAGQLYVADSGNCNIRLLVRSSTNFISSTIAGLSHSPGTADGLGSVARFNNPTGVAVDSATNIYVADSGNHSIRTIIPAGTNWVVGTSAGLSGNAGASEGVGGAARFNSPFAITVDSKTNVFVADSFNDTIRGAFPGVPALNSSAPLQITPLPQAGMVALNWNAAMGHSYQIQYKTNLNQTTWSNQTSVTAPSSIERATIPMGTDPQRFYRVIQVQ